MRYMIVNYQRRPSGQLDEKFAVSRNLKNRDLDTAAVIVDFQTKKVIKASFDGAIVPKNFDRVVGYYHQHYRQHIDQLLQDHGIELSSESS